MEPIVRIAERMDVAFRAGRLAGGNFENFGKTGRIKVARRANLNLRIGGLADERRKPADFQLESDYDQKVGVAEFQKEAGLGFNEMRVLVAAGNGFDVDFFAANFLGEGREVGGRCHDTKFAVRKPRLRTDAGPRQRPSGNT